MTRHKHYNTNERPGNDGGAEDTAVLETGMHAAMRARLRDSARPPGSGLRRVHASLYTLQAYKRWMHQVRETWKNDKR